MNSLWKETVKLPQFESLKGNLKTDILIIGGGITGLLCAYKLHKAGINYALIEADRICNGVTANTTAKITSQHGIIYNKLISKYGTEKAKMYYTANQKALEEYRKLCENIECEFQNKDAYIYSILQNAELEAELEAVQKLGIKADFCKNLLLPLNIHSAIKFINQAQFNPLKFAAVIAKDLNIYENTKAISFNGNDIEYCNGKITAQKIIVATHFPIFNKHGKYFLKLYQQRSYVIAYENLPHTDGMYLEARDNGISIRQSGEYVLIGGGGHRTGKSGGNWADIEWFAKKYYTKPKEKYRWATQDCMSLDGIPYIGEYAKGKTNLYVATGFNKWGMTSAMVAANILSDLVQNKKNEYTDLFLPYRSIIQPQLAINAFETTVNLLTPTAPRCPHLGCALKWNKAEHSWDCSCHGSRFSAKGKLLNNPATDDLKNLKS